MQNDFYIVTASASRITDLTKAGIPRASVQRRADGHAVYGKRVFPRWRYIANLGFFEVEQSAQADALAGVWQAKGLSTSVRYHAAD